jgi:hypothetical protein
MSYKDIDDIDDINDIDNINVALSRTPTFINNRSNKSSKNTRTTFGFFDSTARLYMMANASNDSLRSNYSYRIDQLGVKPKKIKPHITMMHMHINLDNPDSAHLVKRGKNGLIINNLFKQVMTKKYGMLSSNIYLKSRNSSYKIMGDFLAKVYKHDGDINDITDFRMAFYLYLKMYLGEHTRVRREIGYRVFYVYSYNGKELVAVPEYYHGKGVWKPHLSIVKIKKIKRENPALFDEFIDEYEENEDRGVRVLTRAMKGGKGSMNAVNMKMHFDDFVITAMEL